MDRSNLLGELMATDIIEPLEFMLKPGAGYYIDPITGKFRIVLAAAGYDHPWIYYVNDKERYCALYQHFFRAFKMIPRRCMKCWKVVVAPRTIVELFTLNDLMVAHPEMLDCKCGVELRDFVGRNYGGYYYNNSLKDGQAKYEAVRALVDEHLSPEVPVILKKYCTEFEMLKGPSKAYNRPKDADHWEDLFFKHVTLENYSEDQPEIVKRHIQRKWLEFAWARGDMTVKEFNNGEPLYTPTNTYHEEKK